MLRILPLADDLILPQAKQESYFFNRIGRLRPVLVSVILKPLKMEAMEMNESRTPTRQAWNQGKLIGQKAPLRLRDIWGIRIRLELARNVRDLALFDLAIDSKLRACDLTKLRVRDVAHGTHVAAKAIVIQQKTQRPVQFEIIAQTQLAVEGWVEQARLKSEDFLFPSRLRTSEHLSTRQYSRIVKAWVTSIGLDPCHMAPTPCDAPRPH